MAALKSSQEEGARIILDLPMLICTSLFDFVIMQLITRILLNAATCSVVQPWLILFSCRSLARNLHSSGYTQSTCPQGGGPCEGFEKRWRTTTTSVRGV